MFSYARLRGQSSEKTLQEIESSQISDKACQHANFQTFYSGLETAALTRVMAWETNLSQTNKTKYDVLSKIQNHPHQRNKILIFKLFKTSLRAMWLHLTKIIPHAVGLFWGDKLYYHSRWAGKKLKTPCLALTTNAPPPNVPLRRTHVLRPLKVQTFSHAPRSY